MNYEVTAHSFDDAVAFMSKVSQKEDHRRLIRVTALTNLNNHKLRWTNSASSLTYW
jgi:hypothetical protein